eukprot:gene15393-18213_t
MSVAQFSNCVLNGNVAVSDVYGNGGAVSVVNSRVSFVGCLLFNNSGAIGGGIYLAENSQLTLEASHMYGNLARTGGGGGLLASSGNFVILNQSVVTSNIASTTQSGGGGVFLSSGQAIVVDTLIDKNIAAEGAGLLLQAQSLAVIQRSVLSGNVAMASGGAVASVNSTTVLSAVNTTGNVASEYSGGAVSASDGSSITVNASSRITGNRANLFGGGIFLQQNGTLSMSQGSLLASNTGKYEGGCLSLAHGSLAYLSDVEIADCGTGGRGGGLFCDSYSSLRIQQSLIHRCRATQWGGGLSLGPGSNLVATGVRIHNNSAPWAAGCHQSASTMLYMMGLSISGNTATAGGGALLMNAKAVGVVNTSWISANSAARGGGIALEKGVASLRVENTTLQDNRAEDYGAAAYVQAPSNESELCFSEVLFRNNSAMYGGENLFWEYNESLFQESTVVECSQCVSVSESPLISTTAMNFYVEHPDVRNLVSGAFFDSPLAFRAKDYYNNSAMPPVEEVIIVVTTNTENVGLAGAKSVAYFTETGAVFEDLQVSGPPGKTAELSFLPSTSTWQSASLQVRFTSCVAGERYIEATERCEPCPPGYIKWDNTTSECSSCDDSGLTCFGGATYSLDSGYWMAVGSIGRCEEGDTQCVLDRVYPCAVTAACDAKNLVVNSSTGYLLEDLCASGY